MAHSNRDADGNLLLSARTIPLPSSISPEARRSLASPLFVSREPPEENDKAAWKAYAAAVDAMMLEMFDKMLPPFAGSVSVHGLSNATLYELAPAALSERNRNRAVLYVHGGAYVVGGGLLAVRMAQPLAVAMGCRVFSIDYRMPPDHPYPAAVDDAVEAYRYVIARYTPDNVGVCGSSAGAGLAAAAILKARDTGLPLPGAAVLLSPEADLTESGDSFETNRDIDVVLKKRLTPSIAQYANGHDLRSPYLSPLFGDFTKGFPPTFLQTGTRDLFLSNTVRFHRALRRAGLTAELHVCEAMPHGGFFGAPEDKEIFGEQLRFLDERLGLAEPLPISR